MKLSNCERVGRGVVSTARFFTLTIHVFNTTEAIRFSNTCHLKSIKYNMCDRRIYIYTNIPNVCFVTFELHGGIHVFTFLTISNHTRSSSSISSLRKNLAESRISRNRRSYRLRHSILALFSSSSFFLHNRLDRASNNSSSLPGKDGKGAYRRLWRRPYSFGMKKKDREREAKV